MDAPRDEPRLPPKVEELLPLLDQVAADERATLAEARRTTGTRGEDRVREILARAQSMPMAAAQQPNRRGAWLAAAGILCLAALGYLWATRPSHPPNRGSGVTLGLPNLGVFAPRLDPDGSEILSWNAVGERGVIYEVVVEDRARERTLHGPVTVERPELRLPASTVSGWPTAIRVSIEARDSSGALVAAGSADVSRSPR